MQMTYILIHMFPKTCENVMELISDRVTKNTAVATEIIIEFVGCASHALALRFSKLALKKAT